MGSVILVWLAFAVFIAVKNLKHIDFSKTVKTSKRPKTSNSKPGASRVIQIYEEAPQKKNSENKASLIADMMEDRQRDWLARQIREEQRLLEKGDLLDLGARHSKSCSADEIRKAHAKEHDDSIDNGEA